MDANHAEKSPWMIYYVAWDALKMACGLKKVVSF